jgi:tRNA pseudouridine38-40 synthase
MPRYFLEVAYKGTQYHGFQIQQNANSVQAEVEKAFAIYFRQPIQMTGSSRTDSGVHALQNFFHFDFPESIPENFLYNINSLLPSDIVAHKLHIVSPEAHCRYDASSREYRYYIYKKKNPFVDDRAYYFPYILDMAKMEAAAELIRLNNDFSAFSKRNTQVNHFLCTISTSVWLKEPNGCVYQVESNRFLRGMVRGLVGTMLQVGRGKISLSRFELVLKDKNSAMVDFSVPGHGLFLTRVNYPEGLLGFNKR